MPFARESKLHPVTSSKNAAHFPTITDAAVALAQAGAPMPYSRLYRAVTVGEIRARRVGSRWAVLDDLPTIAKALSVEIEEIPA